MVPYVDKIVPSAANVKAGLPNGYRSIASHAAPQAPHIRPRPSPSRRTWRPCRRARRPRCWPQPGDAITGLDAELVQHKVRLAGMNAPENKQPFGTVSQQHLSALVFGRQVVVDAGKTDRYGRAVGRVLVNGRDTGLEQVAAGLAWHYKTYQREQMPEDRDAYARVEDGARAARRGLWRDAKPVAPWDWRKNLCTVRANQPLTSHESGTLRLGW